MNPHWAVLNRTETSRTAGIKKNAAATYILLPWSYCLLSCTEKLSDQKPSCKNEWTRACIAAANLEKNWKASIDKQNRCTLFPTSWPAATATVETTKTELKLYPVLYSKTPKTTRIKSKWDKIKTIVSTGHGHTIPIRSSKKRIKIPSSSPRIHKFQATLRKQKIWERLQFEVLLVRGAKSNLNTVKFEEQKIQKTENRRQIWATHSWSNSVVGPRSG